VLAGTAGINMKRFRFIGTSPQAFIMVCYVSSFFIVGVTLYAPGNGTNSVLSALAMSSFYIILLFLDALPKVCRLTRCVMATAGVSGCLMCYFFSTVLWDYDPVVLSVSGAFNGTGTWLLNSDTTLRRNFLYRTITLNLGLLTGGCLYTTVVKDWRSGHYMMLATGYIVRDEVLAMEMAPPWNWGGSSGAHSSTISDPLLLTAEDSPTLSEPAADHTYDARSYSSLN
jgi:hypothetical protein